VIERKIKSDLNQGGEREERSVEKEDGKASTISIRHKNTNGTGAGNTYLGKENGNARRISGKEKNRWGVNVKKSGYPCGKNRLTGCMKLDMKRSIKGTEEIRRKRKGGK